MTYSDSSSPPGCKDEYEQGISDYYYSLPEGWQDEEIERQEEQQKELEEEERQREDKLSQDKNVKREPE